jgi:predicted alpha/beta hydrolase family esterase
MPDYLILPGYGGSGPMHWQTWWEARDPAFRRIRQKDWDHPVRGVWVETLERAVAASPGDVVLVAHSLACLLVAHWGAATGSELDPRLKAKVKAALLVGPPDPDGPAFPRDAMGFAPIPAGPLPFPSLLIASTDDPYASVDFCLRRSQDWGSRFEVIGPKGHINADSGLGAWEEGRRLLECLMLG